MKCPYKFGHYEFEGGQDCIGAECGMHKLCNAENEITAAEFDALDEHAQALERENAELRKLCGANDAPPMGTFQVSRDNGSTFLPPVKIQGEQDTRERLEADALELVDNLRVYGFNYAGDAEVEIIGMLDRQEAITERECFERSVFDLGAHKQIAEQGRTIVEYADKNAELQKQVDELTAELTAARKAHAQAEHEAATLRDKLGRMLDNAHEITRIGGDC